ncbi:unnamed protein product [Acanthoscelides obtectus]|uniref:Uncharacterized protein n=1 Tax=Acanthoscelides obtectus TaxID=200917 RepID=A0A9P0P264_ACAOB|nr:unnamed protein product [Acanthoscelides obtectus]CAK1647088.1 Protein yellow [Acanthoscelides obtectus]
MSSLLQCLKLVVGLLLQFGGHHDSCVAEEAAFCTIWSWNYVNYTWPSDIDYHSTVRGNRYLPQNILLGGPRVYQDKVYVTMPKYRIGVPASLGFFPLVSLEKTNILITPFPSWEMNHQGECRNLQSVIATEIDRQGIMWVLDGHRSSNYINGIRCPAKMVLMDLNRRGAVIQVVTFPNEISLKDGGFLNDLVIDETDGTYVYITDNSAIDPGLVVYSYNQNRAWKLRDGSMFPQVSASGYVIDNGFRIDYLGTIDGLALSPFTDIAPRLLFYTPLTSNQLFCVTTDILKDQQLASNQTWRRYVKFVGEKQGSTDGMVMDNKGNLYYGLIPQSAVAKWNIFEPLKTAEIIHRNPKTMVWPDSFSMDLQGNLFLVTDHAHRFFVNNNTLLFTPDEIKFRIHVIHVGTRSYMYSFSENFQK